MVIATPFVAMPGFFVIAQRAGVQLSGDVGHQLWRDIAHQGDVSAIFAVVLPIGPWFN